MDTVSQNPLRLLLTQTEKKGVFSKKEITLYAVGDENGNPLTAFEFASIDPYKDGFATAVKKRGGRILLDIDGQEVLPAYRGYCICPWNGYLTLFQTSSKFTEQIIMNDIWRDSSADAPPSMFFAARGLANYRQEILIDPKKCNFMQIFSDIVLYGNFSPVGPDYREFGVGILTEDDFAQILPCKYNHAEYLWDRFVAMGRYVVNKTSTPTSITKNTVTVTSQLAFQVFDVDTGKPVSDMVFISLIVTGLTLLIGVVFKQRWAFSDGLLLVYMVWITIKSIVTYIKDSRYM